MSDGCHGDLRGSLSGDNRSREKVAMTAPVSQERKGEKIKMTAPVGQRSVRGKWAVSFMMSASYTLETLPEPENPKIALRQVPARRMAAVRYSGFWSEKNYLRYNRIITTLPVTLCLHALWIAGFYESGRGLSRYSHKRIGPVCKHERRNTLFLHLMTCRTIMITFINSTIFSLDIPARKWLLCSPVDRHAHLHAMTISIGQ